MALLDPFIGKAGIEKQRRMADEVARSKFNPDVLLPQLEEARMQAEEGIADAPIRERTLGRIFATRDFEQSDVGAGQGRFLSLMEESEAGRASAVSEAETEISLQEERAQREGRMKAAQIMGKRRQLEAQREAQMKQNRLMAEAEASRRRKALTGKIAGFALSAVGGAPAIGGAIGDALGIGTPGLDRPSAPNPEPTNDIIEEDFSNIDFGLDEEIDNFVGF